MIEKNITGREMNPAFVPEKWRMESQNFKGQVIAEQLYEQFLRESPTVKYRLKRSGSFYVPEVIYLKDINS